MEKRLEKIREQFEVGVLLFIFVITTVSIV